MTASPNPRLANQIRPFQVFIVAFLTVQMVVDAGYGSNNGAGDQISDHEPGGVIARVLACSETIDALYDIFSAKSGVIAGNAFALNDRVGIVFNGSQEYLDQ